MTNMMVTFATDYDGEGATQFKSGMQDASDQITALGEKGQIAGVNMEGLFRRLERPLSALVFSGVADEITTMGQKGESGTMMVEHGLHAIGMALTFINPLWGALFLAAGEVFNLFEKFGHQKTAEEIQKQFSDTEALKKSLSESADVLLKHGQITKQDADEIKNLAGASEQELKSLQEHTKKLVEDEAAQLKATKARVDGNPFLKDTARGLEEIKEAQDRYNAALQASTGLTEHFKAIDDAKNQTVKDNEPVLQKQLDLQLQDKIDKTSLAEVTKILKDNEEVLDDTRKKILATTDVAELEMLEKKMEHAQELINLEKQHRDELQATADAENESIKSMVQSVDGDLNKLVDSWASGQKSLSDASKEAAAAIVNDFTNMEAGTLEMDAMKNIFINPGLAAAEFAGALAIRAAGSALASTFGGSTTSSSAAPSPSSTTPGPVSSSSGGNQNQSSLTININGGMIDKATVAYIMQSANDLVQQNGMTVVATQINGVTPTSI